MAMFNSPPLTASGQRRSNDPPPTRRAFTLPAKLSAKSPDPQIGIDRVETLYSHPRIRIVSFDPLLGSVSGHSSQARRAGSIFDVPPGTLPWASRTEKTLATGPFRVYIAPHSVVFLNSGSFLHPVLSKTQCWCVDGESKFVLPTSSGSYCRLEFPRITEVDKEKVDEFKAVLARVLRYEQTHCPFKRGFEVELPPEPETPKKLVPWKAKLQPTVSEPHLQQSRDDPNQSLSSSSMLSPKSPLEERLDNANQNGDSAITEPIITSAEETTPLRSHTEENSTRVVKIKEKLESAISAEAKQNEVAKRATNKKAEPIEDPFCVSAATEASDAQEAGEVAEDIVDSTVSYAGKIDNHIALKQSEAYEGQIPEQMLLQHATDDFIQPESPEEWMTARSHNSSFSSSNNDSASDATNETTVTLTHDSTHKGLIDSFADSKPPKTLNIKHGSITSPKMSLGTSPPSMVDSMKEVSVAAPNVEKYYSFHSPISPLPPSPPDSSHGSLSAGAEENIYDLRPEHHASEQPSSDTGLATQVSPLWDLRDSIEPKVMAGLSGENCSQDPTPEPSVKANEQHNTNTPRSDPVTRWSRDQNRPRIRPSDRNVTASVLQATWAILNSPPSHLVNLMITVARKIANGTMKGTFVGQDANATPISLQWDHSENFEPHLTDWGEDDYGVPLRSPSRKRRDVVDDDDESF